MVTYPDASLSSPIVITYKYLGKDIHGAPENIAESGYYFQYLPAFRYDDDDHSIDAPTLFAESQLKGISDIDGLLSELAQVRERASGT